MGNCCTKKKSMVVSYRRDDPPATENETTAIQQVMEHNHTADGGSGRSDVGSCEILVAMYPYEARSEHELTMRKGQKLELIEVHEEGVWLRARDLTTRVEGYVPAAYTAPISAPESQDWFFGDIQRKYAEQLLMSPDNGRGAFLVRSANQYTHKYSLSLKDLHPTLGTFIVKHFRIREDEAGRLFLVSYAQPFYSLHDLIEAYSNGTYGMPCLLMHPCVKPAPTLPDINWETTDNWEVRRQDINLRTVLGEGSFGEVWYGIYDGKYEVAVKRLKPGSMSREAFMKEATIMKKLVHKHIISLYAVCTLEEPIYIITEYMKEGALLNMLKDDEKRENLDIHHLVYISSQIANGMYYLETKNLMHRDLAARNVLVTDGLLCKIADFGLARTIEGEYTQQSMNKFPVKWTAPEALLYSKFSIKSDVWSYGILLYEIFTYGANPYPGMTNAQVAQLVPAGHRMTKPSIFPCPDEIYEMMLSTWQASALKRPTFEYLNEALSQLEVFGSTKEYQ